MTAGRPKVDPEDYNPDWEEQMLDGYARGKSDVWVRVKCFGNHIVSNDLWSRWQEEIEEFSVAVRGGRELSRIWWENLSQDSADGTNTKGNFNSIKFNMTNRFRHGDDAWKDRQEIVQTTKVGLDIEELDKLKEFLEEHNVPTDDL